MTLLACNERIANRCPENAKDRSRAHWLNQSLSRIVCLVALGGCGGAQVTLQVQGLSLHAQSPQQLPVDGTLRSGDRFLLRVEAAAPAYVYAMRPLGAEINTLYPPQGSPPRQAVSAGAPLFIPGPGRYFELDRQTGRERIVVVASMEPLDERALYGFVVQQTGLVAREAPTQDKERPPEQPPPRPPVVGPRDKDGERSIVRGVMRPRKPAVLRFGFNHEATQDGAKEDGEGAR